MKRNDEHFFDVVADAPPPDALSERTRKERRSLLLASLLGMAITWGNLIPSQISAFGIVVSDVEQKSLLALLFFVVTYFLCGFLLYAVPEYRHWHVRDQLFRERLAGFFKPKADTARGHAVGDLDNEAILAVAAAARHAQLAGGLLAGARARALFDFAVPALAALVALTFILASALGLPVFSSTAPIASVGFWSALLATSGSLSLAIRSGLGRWRKSKPLRTARRIAAENQGLLEKMRAARALPEDSPERAAAVDRINTQIRQMIERYEHQRSK